MAEGVLDSMEVDVGEEMEGFDEGAQVHGVVRHVPVTLTKGPTLDTTKANGLFLRAVLNDLEEEEAVGGEAVGVGPTPDSTGGGRVIGEAHTRPPFTSTPAGEDLDSMRFGNRSKTGEDLLDFGNDVYRYGEPGR